MVTWRRFRRLQATAHPSTTLAPGSDPELPALSPQEFAIVACLAGAPDGIRPAACAKALRRDLAQVSDVLASLSARELAAPGQHADTVVLTDRGRRAFAYAQAPCCTRITRY